MRKLICITIIALCIVSCTTTHVHPIQKEIESIVDGKDLKIGFALYDFQTKESIYINATDRYPMQSVYKFPIAVAALKCAEMEEFRFRDSITIDKSELYDDIWSPISKTWSDGLATSYHHLLLYMVAHSDNLATDIILQKIGSPSRVQQIIDSLGAVDIIVRNTERELNDNRDLQYDNYTTPAAMIDFIKLLDDGKLLSEYYTDVLIEAMRSSSTGSIRRHIPDNEAMVGYKTGFSGVDENGVIAAQNVVGIIDFEHDQRITFAVFITESKEPTDTGYDIIANIGKAIYTHYASGEEAYEDDIHYARNPDTCSAFLHGDYLEPIDIYDAPGGKIIRSERNIHEEDPEYFGVLGFELLEDNDSMYRSIIYINDRNEEMIEGWIYKNRHINVYTRAYMPNSDPVRLYEKPSYSAKIIAKKYEYSIMPLEILSVKGGWAKVRILVGGRYTEGWLGPDQQCDNPYTTCC